jgi:hypothetical protein
VPSFSPHHRLWISADGVLYNIWMEPVDGRDWAMAMFFDEQRNGQPLLHRVPIGTDLQKLSDSELEQMLRSRR